MYQHWLKTEMVRQKRVGKIKYQPGDNDWLIRKAAGRIPFRTNLHEWILEVLQALVQTPWMSRSRDEPALSRVMDKIPSRDQMMVYEGRKSQKLVFK